jgi:ABC-type antimicrobial peptide transport system permease subunit
MRYANAIRNEVAALDRDLAVTEVKTMQQIVDSSESQRENVMVLLSVFAGAGLLLAIIGIYGLMAYSVAQSAKELGIRTALGAQQGDIVWLVFRQVLLLSGSGVGVGLIAAFALSRVLKTLLYGVSATDPATFGVVGLGLLGVALLATLLPALRAARIDPAMVLRVG